MYCAQKSSCQKRGRHIDAHVLVMPAFSTVRRNQGHITYWLDMTVGLLHRNDATLRHKHAQERAVALGTVRKAPAVT